MSDGQAMPEVDRPLPGLDAGIISALPFLCEIDVEQIDVIRAEPKLPAKFSLHVLVFRLLREDSSLGPALFGLEVEVVVMQQAVRPLLGRHLVAVGDHILDLNLDLDAAAGLRDTKSDEANVTLLSVSLDIRCFDKRKPSFRFRLDLCCKCRRCGTGWRCGLS
jgi:hypothetical protein